jgi:hypothetical protein
VRSGEFAAGGGDAGAEFGGLHRLGVATPLKAQSIVRGGGGILDFRVGIFD